MNTIRGINQRRSESTTEQLDVTIVPCGSSVATPLFNGTLSATTQDRQHLTGIGYLLISGLFVLLAFSLLLLVWATWRRRRNHRTSHDDSENPTIDTDLNMASDHRIEQRYETIEHWIITKRVILHTIPPHQTENQEQCGTAISSSLECEDHSLTNRTPECPICMSDIKLGQIVSWSSNPQCVHGMYFVVC
jgi:hypothetical protein